MVAQNEEYFEDEDKILEEIQNQIYQDYRFAISKDDPQLMTYTIAKVSFRELMKILRKELQNYKQDMLLAIKSVEDHEYQKASKVMNDTVQASKAIIEGSLANCQKILDEKVRQIAEMEKKREARFVSMLAKATRAQRAATVSNIASAALMVIAVALFAVLLLRGV